MNTNMVCGNIVKSTGCPCGRPTIEFTNNCGYHAVAKKSRKTRTPRVLEECTICYNDMLHNQPKQACGHRFHDRCIARWLKTGHNTCPLCRTVLKDDAFTDNDTDTDHDNDPTYIPYIPRAFAHYSAPIDRTSRSPGSAIHNPILIDMTPNEMQQYIPTTPNNNQPTYIPSSPVFHIPSARQIVFESP